MTGADRVKTRGQGECSRVILSTTRLPVRVPRSSLAAELRAKEEGLEAVVGDRGDCGGSER